VASVERQGTSKEDVVVHQEEEAFFEVNITDYEESVYQGKTTEVEYSVKNTGNATGTQTIVLIYNDEVLNRDENLTLAPGEEWNNSYIFNVGQGGDIILENEDDSEMVIVTVEEEEDLIDRMREIPGFTSIILLLAVVFAVTIYQKKE